MGRDALDDPVVALSGPAAGCSEALARSSQAVSIHGAGIFGREPPIDPSGRLVGRVPLIVSGPHFASLPGELRDEILSVVMRSLTPDGVFLLYQYSYAMRGKLRQHFSSVEGKWEVRNILPAVVMRCKV